jgi:hypothetical protein
VSCAVGRRRWAGSTLTVARRDAEGGDRAARHGDFGGFRCAQDDSFLVTYVSANVTSSFVAPMRWLLSRRCQTSLGVPVGSACTVQEPALRKLAAVA